MFIDDKISYTAVNEAYCLLTAWMREERIAANYNREEIAECVKFLAEILKHPENFVEEEVVVEDNKSLVHDGLGLA